MKGSSRRRISSAQWWAHVSDEFTNHIKWLIDHAKETEARELKEAGALHECGHQFAISITSAMHAGIEGAGPKSHKDYPFDPDEEPRTVIVRAHSQRDALLVAASLPLGEWFKERGL